jgi:hypothetical protein
VKTTIESKINAEQKPKNAFVLQKEKQEAERKRSRHRVLPITRESSAWV